MNTIWDFKCVLFNGKNTRNIQLIFFVNFENLTVNLLPSEILSYYPTKEYYKDPLDRNILSFCMPAGVSIEVYDEDTLCPLPTSANFVFTREDGVKVRHYFSV